MLKWTVSILLLLNIYSSLYALEISINSAREEHNRYSILHLKDSTNFLCEEIKDDFTTVTKIICAFNKYPNKKITKLQNDFFQITTIVKNKTFFLVIKPFQKIILQASTFDLTNENSIYKANVKMTNNWMIIGYKDKLPLINNKVKPESSINFPFYLDEDKIPFVGGLDIKGNPVHLQKVEDVTEFLKVKKYFQEKKYDLILDSVDEVLDSYPDTLFKAELLFYKIKVFSQLKDFDNVVAISKIFLREYSSDENIPEVLALTAHASALISMNIDADYFFDRLFSEHPNSIFTQWGYIYKGEMLESSGGTKPAIAFYTKALNKASDLEVAATAAYNLANAFIPTSYKKSAKYIKKIIDAKPKFFIKNFKVSKEMMEIFADRGDYKTAASIANALSLSMTKENDDYERLLRDRAMWLAKSDDKKRTLEAINRYIKEYPDGDYIEEIQVAKDALFFESNDLNASAKLDKYNELIQEYTNDSIGNRALYEKAKFLLKGEFYNDVLDFKEDILNLDTDKYRDVENIITDAAVGVMQKSLKEKKCHEVLAMSNDYNITLSDEWDDGIYDCAMKGGDFTLAKSMANKHFKSKDLQERKKWLYRYIIIDFETGNYSDVLDASQDLIALIDDANKSQYKDVYRYIFDTYQRLEQNENVIASIANIEKAFGINYKDLDRYMALVNIGHDRKDDNIVIDYGNKAYKIQTKSKSNPQSPLLEFTLYQAYMNKEDYEKALSVIESLNDVQISKSQRARQKYLLGIVYSKLWRDEDASQAYIDAIKSDENSAWAKLASSAMKL